jgi:hypothetical protein
MAKEKDVFHKTTEYLRGKQTERQINDTSPPSPPSLPGDPLRNRRGDLILAAVSNLNPSIPVDSDENPTVYPLSLDTNGNLRITLANGATVTANVNLISVLGAAISLGQKIMANSLPVVLASDQSAIPVTIATILAMNLTQVGGAAITLGQKVMASSLPVVIASDQSDLPINVDKYGGTATTLGQKVMASSIPVVIASDQSVIAVAPTATTKTPTYSAAGRNGTVAVGITGNCFCFFQCTTPRTMKLKRIYVEIFTTGTAAGVDITLSLAPGGTSNLVGATALQLIPIPHDSADVASNAQIFIISTNSNPLQASTPIRVARLDNGAGLLNPPSAIVFDFGEQDDKAPTLKQNQELQIAIQTIIATQSCTVNFEWTEQ